MSARFVVVIMVVVFMVRCSVSMTFSSKLIHRYSEEARGLSVERRGEEGLVSWPKRKSFQYYEMLVWSDLKRQSIKVGVEYQFIFPSEGNKTISYGNDWGWLHYTWIDVGTPAVSFLVALDAGSDLLWVPCDCVQCAPLSASYYKDLDRDLNAYIPSGSSTSKHLFCTHELCELGPSCKTPKQPCPYIVNYSSENTSSSGFLVEDTLHLASSGGHTSKSYVQAPVIIGCGKKQSGGYLEGVAPDGLLGLGLGDISVPSFLAKQGLVRNSFSMCFNEDDSGRIFFGDQGIATQSTTPFLSSDGKFITYMVEVESCCIRNNCFKQAGFQALVDSGSSFTFLPHEVYEKVTLEFDRRVSTKRTTYEGSPWEYCYKASSQELLDNPSFTLMFPFNNSFVVHNPSFLVYDNQGVTGFCLAIQPTEGNIGTIGQNFMTGYRMVFDRESLKLGWSRSNCQDISDGQRAPPPPSHGRPENPLPTNEHQNSTHGYAVAPALAGKATSNLSTSASSHLIISQFCTVKLLQLLLLLICLFVFCFRPLV